MATVITNYGDVVYLQMVRGDTYQINVEVEGDSITFDSAYFTVKRIATNPTPLFQKSLGNGIEKVAPNEYMVTVAPEDTAGVSAGTYDCDLQVEIEGDITTLVLGKLNIKQDVTFTTGG